MTHLFSDVLALEELGDDRFIIRPPRSGFLFGGLSMAMCLRSAAATVEPDMTPMSVRATFLASGDWGGPHHFEVLRVSASRSFAVRRVEMTTGGKRAILADVVFQRPGDGADWQAPPAPDAAAPESLAQLPEVLPVRLIDIRPLGEVSPERERVHPYWGKAIQPPDDPTLLACALTFISDYYVVASPFPASSRRVDGTNSTTFTHSLMFHRPLTDGWWLFDCEPLSVSGGRFLSRGQIQAQDGALLASFVQEGVIRQRK